MAGCDGRMKDREYYTDFANNYPEIRSSLQQAAPNTGITNCPWAISEVFPGCWMPGNATTPIHWL